MHPHFSRSFKLQDWRDDLTLRSPTEKEIIAKRIEDDRMRQRRQRTARLRSFFSHLFRPARKSRTPTPPRTVAEKCGSC